jgi:hypothetical protein
MVWWKKFAVKFREVDRLVFSVAMPKIILGKINFVATENQRSLL